MTIIVSVATPEGLVLAGDSRQSYVNVRGNSRIGTDFGSKIFQLSPRISVATYGWAFLQPQTVNVPISVSALIEDFRATLNPEASVADATQNLQAFFHQIYDYDVTALGWNPSPAGEFALGFQVVGYNRNSTIGEVYSCQIPAQGTPILLRNTNNPGSNWNGQIDVVTRLVLGFDPRLGQLPFMQHLAANPLPNQNSVMEQLNGLGYIINWSNMTMQDAIDFAALMVNSTIKMQRFSDGIAMIPGDIAGCGGDIDIAAITHREGFKWVRRKELKAEI